MDILHLLKYLQTDLNELREIVHELKPGDSLNEIEIKLIKSRVRSINEEFNMLSDGLTNASSDIEAPESKNLLASTDGTMPPKDEPEDRQHSHTPLTENNSQNDSQHTIENKARQLKAEKPKETTNETHQKTTGTDDSIEKNATTPQKNHTTNEAVSEDDKDQSATKYEQHNLQERQRTIADKYTGASNSIHERLASHISQNDLASKLQQNPIADLTKAIKVNDKIWFINELFEGNADLYRETINRINQMRDFEEALAFLEDHFTFEQEKESFKSFIEFIYRRFLN